MSAMMTPDLRCLLCEVDAQSCIAKPTDRKELALTLFPWYVPATPKS